MSSIPDSGRVGRRDAFPSHESRKRKGSSSDEISDLFTQRTEEGSATVRSRSIRVCLPNTALDTRIDQCSKSFRRPGSGIDLDKRLSVLCNRAKSYEFKF